MKLHTLQNARRPKLQFKSISQAKRLTGLSYLGSVNSSAKIVKGQKYNVSTYILYLAPANLSGYEVCPMRTRECSKACLFNSGRAKMFSAINKSRIKKTKLFFEHRTFFLEWLFAEIAKEKSKAKKNGQEFAVRINGTSDLDLRLFKLNGKNILETFKDVQFYDYTKAPKRLKQFKDYSNYHLTLSYTGKEKNKEACINALLNGFNVATVFANKLPKSYKGFEVINGDESDLRYKDKKGIIVGLKFKTVKESINFDNNPFIINSNDKDCLYV